MLNNWEREKTKKLNASQNLSDCQVENRKSDQILNLEWHLEPCKLQQEAINWSKKIIYEILEFQFFLQARLRS
jgi:hypothetical protein